LAIATKVKLKTYSPSLLEDPQQQLQVEKQTSINFDGSKMK